MPPKYPDPRLVTTVEPKRTARLGGGHHGSDFTRRIGARELADYLDCPITWVKKIASSHDGLRRFSKKGYPKRVTVSMAAAVRVILSVRAMQGAEFVEKERKAALLSRAHR